MLRRLTTALQALIALAAITLVFAVPAGAESAQPSQQMVAQINALRATHGVGRLRPSESLRRSALSYGRFMLAHDFFGHSGGSARPTTARSS